MSAYFAYVFTTVFKICEINSFMIMCIIDIHNDDELVIFPCMTVLLISFYRFLH